MQKNMYQGTVSIGKLRLNFWETLGIGIVLGVSLYGVATMITFYCMEVLCVK